MNEKLKSISKLLTKIISIMNWFLNWSLTSTTKGLASKGIGL